MNFSWPTLTVLALLLIGCGSESGDSASKTATGAAVNDALSDVGDAAKDAADQVVDAAQDAVAAVQAGATEVMDGEIDLAAGEATYNRYCFSCHASGVAAAPKLGDKAAWAPRVAKGLDALVASSVTGIPPGMPPMGLCMSCEESELRNAIAWMIAQ